MKQMKEITASKSVRLMAKSLVQVGKACQAHPAKPNAHRWLREAIEWVLDDDKRIKAVSRRIRVPIPKKTQRRPKTTIGELEKQND